MAFIAERVQKDAITRLEAFVNAPFERIDYTDAIKLLQKSGQKFDFPVEWGLDLQTEHERWLTEQHVGRPVVVTNYPEHIKAFYMRLNDDGKTVAAMDVLAPGIGEIIGGSSARSAWTCSTRAWRSSGWIASIRLVSRFPPLRHRAARRFRPGLRAPGRLRLRPVQHPRRDALPARAGPGRVLIVSTDVILFFALLFVAIAIAGATAFVIFWPLTLVHVRDRQPGHRGATGHGAFLKPSALAWLLRGGYRATPRSLAERAWRRRRAFRCW